MAKSNNNLLLKYAGLGTQLIVGLVIMVYGGLWLDEHFAFKNPLLTWIMPLLFIFGMLFKLIKDASSKKDS